MAKTKSSTPVNASVLGAAVSSSSTAAPAVSSNVVPVVAGTADINAAGGTAAGNTGTGTSPAGAVLASLGVTNSGFTQVQVESLVSSKFETKIEKRLDGVQNYLPAGTSLLFNGQTYTVASIVSVLQAVVGLFTAKATAQSDAKAAVSAATAALKAELPVANQFLTGLDSALVSMFGKGNPVLTNFGLSTGVKKTPSSTTKAKATGTAKLTRTARNTMGKVQKAALREAYKDIYRA